jgi:hypothetical protein
MKPKTVGAPKKEGREGQPLAPPPTPTTAPVSASSSQRTSASAARFAFLQLQVPYFMAQITIGDAKAGGIIVFVTAVSSLTGQKLDLGSHVGWTQLDLLALFALACSAITCTFAFQAIWPRGIANVPGAKSNLFSWVSLARMGANSPGTYYRKLKTSSEEDLVEPTADTVEELAGIIARKYNSVRFAFIALVVATAAHVAYWVLR